MPNIQGIKESSGNLPQITEVIHLLPARFKVYSGDDNVALSTIVLGAAGLISVASNVIPREMTDMVGAALAMDWPRARRLNRLYFPANAGPVLGEQSRPGESGAGNDGADFGVVPAADGACLAVNRRNLERLAGELGLLNNAPQEEGDPRMF